MELQFLVKTPLEVAGETSFAPFSHPTTVVANLYLAYH